MTTRPRAPIARRAFLADLGRGGFAIAVVSVLGCTPTGGGATAEGGPVGGSPASSPDGGVPATSAPTPATDPSPAPGGGVAWQRVNLGFVSAYVLARAGEAAVVDTGTGGSADAIEAAVQAAGLGWDAVGHVILTHHHGDHVGSLGDVLARTGAAAAYAGEADIPQITSPRPLTPLTDGDEVFGLTIVATPGHTPGHVAVLDPVGGILVAGDALNTDFGKVVGPSARFTANMDVAFESVARLATLEFETLLVGHGDPIETGASGLVAELAAAGS